MICGYQLANLGILKYKMAIWNLHKNLFRLGKFGSAKGYARFTDLAR